jgi:hypothetical protein
MNLRILWRYPVLYKRGSRGFEFIPYSKKDKLTSIVGETLAFLIGFLGSGSLLLVEVLTGQNFGHLSNLFLIVVSLIASFSTTFSLVMFRKRELFVSLTRHTVHLEALLSNGNKI